jgi:leader peptidase (prepilin peptidase) / N-methyltransferase
MFETYFYMVSFFVLGTIMGSFFNVAGYRLPKGMSIIKPSSHCPHCSHKLKPSELIPVFSYIIQLGKCRKCKKTISAFYPMFEFLSGILFLLSYLTFGMTFELLVSLTFVSILIMIVISDHIYMIIPDELLLLGGTMLFIQRLMMGYSFADLAFNAAIPFVILLLIKLFGDTIFKKESLGGGDIKLMLLFGIVLGWELSLFAIFLASFIAFPIALVILKVKKTNILPFGPFLSLAAIIIYFLQIEISWILDLII